MKKNPKKPPGEKAPKTPKKGKNPPGTYSHTFEECWEFLNEDHLRESTVVAGFHVPSGRYVWVSVIGGGYRPQADSTGSHGQVQAARRIYHQAMHPVSNLHQPLPTDRSSVISSHPRPLPFNPMWPSWSNVLPFSVPSGGDVSNWLEHQAERPRQCYGFHTVVQLDIPLCTTAPRRLHRPTRPNTSGGRALPRWWL